METIEDKVEKSRWEKVMGFTKNKVFMPLVLATGLALGASYGCGGNNKEYNCETACRNTLSCCEKTIGWTGHSCSEQDFYNFSFEVCVPKCEARWDQLRIRCFSDYCWWTGTSSNPVRGFPPECEDAH